MKLSIITVNYNNREGLQRTINSVVSQTWRDFEWIVIDGGSTDGSKELIEKYQDHFSYWCSEPDKGIYNAMNKGIAHARGEYLQFLNSGDSLYDNEVLQKVFGTDRKADIIFGKPMMIYADGSKKIYEREDGKLFTPFNLIYQTINHQSAFCKRDLFAKYGFYDETYRIIADRKFFWDAIIRHNSSVESIDTIIVNFPVDGISSNVNSIEEKEHLIAEYLTKESVTDYYIYIKGKTYAQSPPVVIYEELTSYWLIRKLVHLLYKILRCAKLRKNT